MFFKICITFFALVCGLVAAPPKIPLPFFFRGPNLISPRVSPDGQFVAYIEGGDDFRQIIVKQTAGQKRWAIDPAKGRKVHWCEWTPNGRIVFGMVEDVYETGALFVMDHDGQNLEVLVRPTLRQNDDYPITSRFIMVPEEAPDMVYILVRRQLTGNLSPSVYRVNMRTKARSLVENNQADTFGWILDQKANVRIGIRVKSDKMVYMHREAGGKRWEVLREVDETGATFEPLRFHEDGEHLYVLSNQGRKTDALFLFSTKTKEFGPMLFGREDYDISSDRLDESWDGREVYYDEETPRKEVFDKTLKAQHRSIDKALPGRFNTIVSRSRDGTVAVVASSSDREPREYFLANLEKMNMTQLGRSHPQLVERHLAPMRPVSFRSRDGLTLHGYLTLPEGVEAKGLPFVILPHGGPWVRDVWGFDPETQFLANRGYGVLQLNFRGSTGYGVDLYKAGFKELGNGMLNDIADGVAWVVAQGYADSKRIGIYGASYGGYAALAELCFNPELFRCGVSLCGVMDLRSQYQEFARSQRMAKHIIHLRVGDLKLDRERLQSRSPLQNVDKIMAPVLLAHGDLDPVVDVSQTVDMAKALEKRGKKVVLMRKRDEFHGFLRAANRIDFYEAMERFLAEHLGPMER